MRGQNSEAKHQEGKRGKAGKEGEPDCDTIVRSLLILREKQR